MKDDLCYFPTQRLCSLGSKLDDSYFPDDLDSVFKQEVTTYMRVDGGIKVMTHTRNFSGGSHYDSRSSEVMRVSK